MSEEKLQQARQQAGRLLHDRKSAMLATCGVDGRPHASYAPFVRTESGEIWLYLSELAQHYHNLTANPQASLLLVEDEAEAGNIFARKRLTLECIATPVARSEERSPQIFQRFREKFGAFFSHLQTMQDFHLFCLKPQSGTLVLGFGAAFCFSAGELQQIASLEPKRNREVLT